MTVEIENYKITAPDEYNNIVDYEVEKKKETYWDHQIEHITVLDDVGMFYGVTVEREMDKGFSAFIKQLLGKDLWDEEVNVYKRTSYDSGMEKGMWEEQTLEDFREFLEGSDTPVDEIMD